MAATQLSQDALATFCQKAREFFDPKDLQDIDLQKFLVARNGDQHKALEQYRQAVQWREKMNIPQLLKEDFKDLDDKGLLYIPPNLRAKDGTKLGFWRSWQHLSKSQADTDRAFRFVVYCLERARANGTIQPGDKLTIVYDRKYATRANMDFNLMKQIISAFQQVYPEGLSVFIFFPTNYLFQVGWAIAKTLLDPATTTKLRLCSSSEWEKTLLEYIDPSQLPRRYNGTWRDKYDLDEIERKHAKFSEWKSQGFEEWTP